MRIFVQKFGTTLISRPAGKEAYLAFQSSLENIPKDEIITVDFEGVITLSPSWADEFLSPLIEKNGDKVQLVNITNASVMATLQILNLLPKR